MSKYLLTLAVLVFCLFVAGPAGAQTTVINGPSPDYTCTNDDCTQTSWCDLYDADCVTAYANYGFGLSYAVTYPDVTDDVDAYGYGGTCNWVAIVDYWYAYVFNSYSWVGVLQAYICHRGQLVTRFDQISTFADQRFGFPWTLAYHLSYSVPTPPQRPDVPTYYASTTSELQVGVCFHFNATCSWAHPRYVIQWSAGKITCYVNGYPFPDCVGHRYR